MPEAMRIEPVTLEGEHVRLQPLSLDHLDALWAVALDRELWRWSPTPVRNREEFRAYLEVALKERDAGSAMPFATMHRKFGEAIGSTRFAGIDRENRKLEIGWTWIGRRWQRTAANSETKYMMLRHAFERLGCIRVELKTDSLNQQSRNAILRLGAKEEGIFRNHRITFSGRYRHSVYYSILDSEWPSVKERLQERLRQ